MILANRIKPKHISLLFFIIYFAIGINIVKDYGISLDEPENRQQGFILLNHIGEKIIPNITQEIKGDRDFVNIYDYPGGYTIDNVFNYTSSLFDYKYYLNTNF